MGGFGMRAWREGGAKRWGGFGVSVWMGGGEGGLKSWALFTTWCSSAWVERYKSTLPCPLVRQRQSEKRRITCRVLFDSAAGFSSKSPRKSAVLFGDGCLKTKRATVMDGGEGD